MDDIGVALGRPPLTLAAIKLCHPCYPSALAAFRPKCRAVQLHVHDPPTAAREPVLPPVARSPGPFGQRPARPFPVRPASPPPRSGLLPRELASVPARSIRSHAQYPPVLDR